MGSRYQTQRLMTLIILVMAPFSFMFSAHAQVDPGFEWVNPRPTGDVVWDIERAAPGVFVAVTENGFIMVSDDRGSTWTHHHTRILENLWAVDAADGIVVVGAEGGVLHVSEDLGSSWREIHIPDFSQNLRDVAVIDRDHWVSVGSTLSNNGVVVVTRDGGETWNFIDPGVPVAFRSVGFIDSLHGWASGTPGTVISTTDGGDTWSVDQSPLLYGASLNVIRFGSIENGLVAGEFGRLFITHDGGKTWVGQPQSSSSIFNDAAWLDDTTVVLVGKRQQMRSTDAGRTWEEVLAGSHPLGIGFGEGRDEAMVAGDGGQMLYTEDGGLTWLGRSGGPGERNIFDLDLLPSGVGYAVGYGGAVFRSDDGGDSWMWTERMPPYVPGHLTRVFATSETDVVVVAEEGAVYHSSTRGKRWSNAVISTDRRLRDIDFADSTNGWIVGNGVVYTTTDGGASWDEDLTSFPFGLWGVHAVSASRVYITGDGGRVFVTENGGDTWEQIDSDLTVRFTMIHADLDGRITLGWPGGLIHSSDGGQTWSDHPAPAGASLRDFSFLSPTHGWCGQDDGPLLTTTDAGATWDLREHGLRTSPYGRAGMWVVELLSPGQGFVAGSAGFIMRYRDPEISGVEEGGQLRPSPVDTLDLSFRDVDGTMHIKEEHWSWEAIHLWTWMHDSGRNR